MESIINTHLLTWIFQQIFPSRWESSIIIYIYILRIATLLKGTLLLKSLPKTKYLPLGVYSTMCGSKIPQCPTIYPKPFNVTALSMFTFMCNANHSLPSTLRIKNFSTNSLSLTHNPMQASNKNKFRSHETQLQPSMSHRKLDKTTILKPYYTHWRSYTQLMHKTLDSIQFLHMDIPKYTKTGFFWINPLYLILRSIF